MVLAVNTHSFEERILTAVESINTGILSLAEGEAQGAFACTYTFGGADFGATFTEDIVTPPGVRGTVQAIDVINITEEFSGDTTAAQVRIGTTTDTDAYAVDVPIPDTTAVAAAITLAVTAGVTRVIPAASTFRVTGTVGVDAGADEGICDLLVTVLYFV